MRDRNPPSCQRRLLRVPVTWRIDASTRVERFAPSNGDMFMFFQRLLQMK